MIRPEDKFLYPYLAGSFITSSQPWEVKSPYNQALISTTYMCSAEIMEEAIVKAVNAREACKNLSSWEKYTALMFIAAEIKNDREYLATLLAMEAAKPYVYALAEIDRATQTFIVAAEESKRIAREYISLDWTPAGKGKQGWVNYVPAGVVAGISPFNFPLNLAVHKIAPAIAAGCPIILKPASSTPLSTLLLSKIIHKAGLPAGAVSILPADRTSGNILVTDNRIALLSFTGSDVVGWKMKAQAGKKKTVMELGGNAGTIVTPHITSLQTVVDKCFTGAFAYQGQICIHSQRFWVHTSVYQDFVNELAKKIPTLKTGAPENPETTFTSMIDEENAARVEAWVNEAIQGGATLVAGGKRTSNFYEPTILTGTHSSMKVESEELFGPVVVIKPYDEFKQAVAELNAGRFGLQASVFSWHQQEIDEAFELIEAGGIIINEATTLRLDHMPYGGVKDSGLGREGVKYAMMDMLEPRLLVK